MVSKRIVLSMASMKYESHYNVAFNSSRTISRLENQAFAVWNVPGSTPLLLSELITLNYLKLTKI